MSGDIVEEIRPRALVRPSIPPLAWLTAGVWAGILTAEAAAWRVFGGMWPAWAGAGVVVAALASAAALWRSRRAAWTLLCVGFATGAVAGGVYWHGWSAEVAAARCGGSQMLSTSADVAMGPFGPSVTGIVTDGSGVRRRVIARFSRDAVAPELGAVTPVSGSLTPAVFDERGRGLHKDAVLGTFRVRSVHESAWAPGPRGGIGRVRAWCVAKVRAVPGPAGALLSGVLLGDRRLLAHTPAELDFRTTGLTHLVAVSGSHLVVVAAVFAWLLERLRARRAVSVSVVLAIMAAYVVATGVQPSAIRALVMAAVAVGAVSGGRRTDRAAALCAAAAGALVLWPPVAFDLGFALSVASVAGLILFARFGTGWIEASLPRQVRSLAEPLSLTVVAQAATFPIASPVFGVVSLVAPLANLLVGPLIALMLVVGLVGLALSAVSRALGAFVLQGAGALASLSVWIAGRLATVPAAAVPIGDWGIAVSLIIGVGAMAVWALWPQPEPHRARVAAGAAAFGLAVAVFGGPAPSGAQVVVLDVGQGDAILVRDGPHAALIDTGPSIRALTEALGRQGIRGLEFLAITHAHEDHTGGASALRGVHPVGRVFAPATTDPDKLERVAQDAGTRLVAVQPGQQLIVGSIVLTVLWPRDPVADPAENEASLVMLVERGESDVLLTGDAEDDVLVPLMRAGLLTDVDVLKVGHHGSRVSLTAEALAALSPATAVISVGEGNRFGHPTPEALEMLRRCGATIRRTDREGDVVIQLE